MLKHITIILVVSYIGACVLFGILLRQAKIELIGTIAQRDKAGAAIDECITVLNQCATDHLAVCSGDGTSCAYYLQQREETP